MRAQDAADRVRVWLSNALVIDQWTSLTALAVAATAGVSLADDTPYTLEVQYKTDATSRGVTLKHEAGGSSSIIPSDSLFNVFHFDGGHTEALQAPRRVCGGTSLLSGAAVSLATAAVAATFTITARDEYNNILGAAYAARSGIDTPFVVRVAADGCASSKADVAVLGDGRFTASYFVTSQGAHTLTVSVPLRGALSATYFSDDAFSEGAYLRSDDFSLPASGVGDASSETEWPGLAGEPMEGSSFTVRWEGFVRATIPSNYRLRTRLGDPDDRVKLWIDNSLLINQWSSRGPAVVHSGTFNLAEAGMYYDLKMEFKETSGQQAVELQWQVEPTATVTIDQTGCAVGCAGNTARAYTRGVWQTETTPGTSYASAYYQDGNVNKGSLEAIFVYPEAFGLYEVFLFYPSDASFASNVPISVLHAGGTSRYTLDLTSGGGAWVSLGTFAFGAAGATLVVGNAGTTSPVVADAVRYTRLAPNDDRVLHSGLIAGAPGARTLLLAPGASLVPNEYLHAYLTVGSERRTVRSHPGGNAPVVTVDRAFSMGASTLTSAAAVSDSTIAVTDAAAAGMIVGRFVEVDDELMLITAVSTNTLTVTRAQQGTTATSHVNGAAVNTVIYPSGVVESAVVVAVTSSSEFTLATSAPARADQFVGYTITVGFTASVETRTIRGYSAARVVTVDPPFSEAPTASSSTYSIAAHALYYVSEVPLRDAAGDECAPCAVPPDALASAPRVQTALTVSGSSEGRQLTASGLALTLATAGVAATFTITLKDGVGNDLASDDTVVFANGTFYTASYGYGWTPVATGEVTAVTDAFSFTLSEAAESAAYRYVGYSITIAGETRTVVGYSAARVVTVAVPFSSTPGVSSKFTLSAVATGHQFFDAPGWFAGSACDMSSASGTPLTCDVSYTATAAGTYKVELQVFKIGGLRGNYFHNTLLQGSPVLSRVDSSVNFDWGSGLLTDSARDHVGIRWTGLVKAAYSETYTFTTNTTGFGPVLRVHDTILVSEWETDIGCVSFDPSGGCLQRTESFSWTQDFPDSGVQARINPNFSSPHYRRPDLSLYIRSDFLTSILNSIVHCRVSFLELSRSRPTNSMKSGLTTATRPARRQPSSGGPLPRSRCKSCRLQTCSTPSPLHKALRLC